MNRRRQIALGMGRLVCLAILWSGSAHAEHPGRTHTNSVDPQIAAYAPTRDLAGRLTIAGSDTMQPLLIKLANDFTRQQPGVRFVIEDVGSGEAIKEFIHGYSLQRRGEKARKGHNGATELNLLASSRLMTEQEIATFSSVNGYEPLAIPIAMDAVTVYVNRDNPIQGLTLAQLDAIFGRERKRGYADDITTWGQVGLADRWQGQPIRAYGRSKGSGTRDFFTAVALLDGSLKEGITETPGSASEILAIARDPLAIGYAGTGFQTSHVKAVPIAEDQGKPSVAPSSESVLDGSYPLRRHLYLYVDKGDLNPVLEEFLKFVNSREGQQVAVRAGLYPLSKGEVERNVALLSQEAQTAAAPSRSESKPN